MKFLSWMKNKMHSKDNTIKPEPESPAASYDDHLCKEEISGCSTMLLSIGTFGKNNISDSEQANLLEEISISSSSEEDVLEESRIVAGNSLPSCSRKNSSSLYRKSLSFLLKRAFLCGGPIFKHPYPNPNFDTSRMDKIVKAMITKKKHPKHLDKSRIDNNEEQINANNSLKTNSERK